MRRSLVYALAAGMGWSMSVAPSPAAGWQATVPLEGEVRAQVARALNRDAARIRLELGDGGVEAAGLLEDGVDSVSVRRGSGDQWILTSWSGASARARFFGVGIVEPVAVAARDLPRGHALTTEDVVWEDHVRQLSDDPAADPVGQVAERALRAGELLVAPAVRPPLLVRGGDAVEAVFDEGAVRMSLRATALASARQGGRLPVRLENGRRFEATAIEQGLVRLRLGSGS